jgi:hypothetical protein
MMMARVQSAQGSHRIDAGGFAPPQRHQSAARNSTGGSIMNKLAFCISKLGLLLGVLSVFLLPALYAAPAYAGNWHSWVSNAGTSGNPCTEGSPCDTFATALAQTDAGGEISCINSGSYIPSTGLTITQSVTIDCNGTLAWANGDDFSFTGDAITINGSGIVVHLRNLSISGLSLTFAPTSNHNGVTVTAAALVNIENCFINNWSQSAINVATAANTILNVKNTTIAETAKGISFAPTGGAVSGSINRSSIVKTSGDGIASTGAVYVTVTDSVISNAAGVGVSVASGTALEVDSSSVSNNNTAFATSGGVIRISRNNIYDNNTNFSISGGTIATSGNNNVAVNGATVPNGTITQQ